MLFAGAATLAYTFGRRHAFDADHISAVDDTTRYLLQKGKRPLGVGFFFSLGHSTVVLALSVGIAFATQAASGFGDSFKAAGGIIGHRGFGSVPLSDRCAQSGRAGRDYQDVAGGRTR